MLRYFAVILLLYFSAKWQAVSTLELDIQDLLSTDPYGKFWEISLTGGFLIDIHMKVKSKMHFLWLNFEQSKYLQSFM